MKPLSALSVVETTVVQKLNQGNLRQRGVSVGGVFFACPALAGVTSELVEELDKQKVTKEKKH